MLVISIKYYKFVNNLVLVYDLGMITLQSLTESYFRV